MDISTLLENQGFNVSGNVVSFGSFIGNIIDPQDNNSNTIKIEGNFTLFGKEVEIKDLYFDLNKEIMSIKEDLPDIDYLDLDEIDLEDYNETLLRKMGIRSIKSFIRKDEGSNDILTVRLQLKDRYFSSNNGESLDSDINIFQGNIRYLKSNDNERNEIKHNFINQLAKLLEGKVEEDKIIWRDGVEFEISYYQNIFDVYAIIPTYYGDLAKIEVNKLRFYDTDKNIKSLINSILNQSFICIDLDEQYKEAFNDNVSDLFVDFLKQLGVNTATIADRYEGKSKVIFFTKDSYIQGDRIVDIVFIDDLKEKVKEILSSN